MKISGGFFVGFLDVPTLNLEVVFRQLDALGSCNSSVEEVKTTIHQLNAFLSTSTALPDPEPLTRKNIFPVCEPGSGPYLTSLDTDFAITDHSTSEGTVSGEGDIP